MPSVIHFEVPADDVERAQNFYARIFNWKFERMPGNYNYFSIITKNQDSETGIHGGLMKRDQAHPFITSYISVDSIDDYVKLVVDNGGKILVPKSPVPGLGYMAICTDTEGNPFGFWMDDHSAASAQG